ncbi:E3 ubiquitin-protein ligase bre1 [Mortierella claussenii]|nr:E3 ubiquitin-protein ligase bre1 [Mortierella claussenii]
MDDRGNRKRRLTEEAATPGPVAPSAAANGSPTPFIPPANKRQFTGSGNSSPLGNAKDDTENMTPAEGVLLNFQKEAIWRQIQEYKRETARVQERIARLENKQAEYDTHTSTVDTYWKKLLEDLTGMITQSKLTLPGSDMVLKDGNSFAALLSRGAVIRPEENDQDRSQDIHELIENAIKPTVQVSCEWTKEVALKLLLLIESWAEKRDNFWAGASAADLTLQQNGAIQQLSEQHTAILQHFRKGQKDIDRLEAKCHEFTDHVLRLKNELDMTKNRLHETGEDLSDSTEKLRWLESNIAREREFLESSAISAQAAARAMEISTPATALLNDISEATREELLQFRRQAISRLTELEEMRAQRTQLKENLEKVQAQLSHLSDERIQDSQHAKGLLVQIQSVRHESDHHREEVQRLRAELDDLHSSRRRFMDTLETEEKNRRATLEAEVKKLESDIARVRDSRDRFQQMYESRCTKDDYEMQQNQEIRKIANTRKDRIIALSTEIVRLQDMLATSSDDGSTFAFYLKGPNDKSTLEDLRSKLTMTEERAKKLVIELEASKMAALQTADLAAVAASKARLEEQVQMLSAKLAELDELVGSGTDNDIKALVATIEAKDEAINRLELRVQAHEAVQIPLLKELHTVANAWGQLEEATSRKAIDLAQKDDLIFKLLSDKTRQESKCNTLIRAKDQSANMTAVMKRQSNMQLDQIRRLEEREKSLNQQMATLEKEQIVLTSEVTLHKTTLQEFTVHNSSFKEKFSKQEERLVELQTLLKERADAFESEAVARKRLVEESDTMRRKIEEHAKKSEGSLGDSEAVKQAARYLKLLKCPACDVNFKSHVILRCMHVFCKSCMDKQMEYRQRKCPTCRENFGAKDVKEIYL